MNVRRLLMSALIVLSTPAFAAPPSPLFASDAPVHLTIQAPLNQLMRNRSFTGTVEGTMTDPGGARLPASFALRGITRRASETCDFAPLKVNFTGNPPTGSLFAGQNKLKLVTHCRSNAAFQQNVLLEYAAYRLFNAMTPLSMRARLANIDYVDADGRPIVSRVGFFLEDAADTARRNGLSEVRAGQMIPVNWLQPAAAARYALFQDMISNHDWSMRAGPTGDECCHNARLIGTGAPGQAIPIPYDFDFSGLVGASYATPPDVLPISNVRQRLYRGYCAYNTEGIAAARQFRDQRAALLSVIDQVPGLDAAHKASARSYLDEWFASIATDDRVAAKFKRCV